MPDLAAVAAAVATVVAAPDLRWLRLTVVVLLALCLGGLAAVLRLHLRAWRLLRATPRGRAAGLTPLHVALVSLGVLLWGIPLAWAQVESLRSAPTPAVVVRTVMYGVGAVTILTSLWIVGRVQRRRVTFGRGCTQVTVAEAERVEVEVDTEPQQHPTRE